MIIVITHFIFGKESIKGIGLCVICLLLFILFVVGLTFKSLVSLDTSTMIKTLYSFELAQHTSFLVSLGYIVALILTLVPSPLLEFRYFIIPFLFYMVHIPPPNQVSRTVVALVFYTLIHCVTMYLFLYRPFTWENEPNALQRFMW